MRDFDVPGAWEACVGRGFAARSAHVLAAFLEREARAGAVIYPPQTQRFEALKATSPNDVRVVILGQDPYHGEGQAQGLAFSVPQGIAVPPSLRNIYKELARDLGIAPPDHGNLRRWAEQGVLLLNTVLTVEEGKPASHKDKGWEEITDAIIAHIGGSATPVVFMLWGAHAQKKKALIANPNHLILEAPHPSPLSAHRGFIGCGHFGKANAFLKERAIDW
jgi:uracil-DNA glycosylase